MNYWLLTTEYPPQHGGGISTYCAYTAKIFHHKGHNITVFVSDHSVSGIYEGFENEIRVIRFSPGLTNVANFLGYSAQLSYEFAEVVKRYITKEGAPDILEAQEYLGIAYFIQQFKLLEYPYFRELNIAITCHAPAFLYLECNHDPIYKLPNYWVGQMEKASIRAADLLLSPSAYLMARLKEKMRWEGIKEHVVMNPMYMEQHVNEADFKSNYIVCFGKLSPLKGTFKLLEYFDQLWRNGFTHPLHIIGGTQQVFHPEGRTMEEVIRRKYGHYFDQKLIVLKGQLSPQDSLRELLDAHVVLVPSLVDNFPYTVLEAMSAGKVVLASEQGGHREILENGINGFKFDHTISGNFQEKLLEVLALPDQKVKEIGANAISTVRSKCNPEYIYQQKVELFTKLLEKGEKRVFPFVEPIAEHESLYWSDQYKPELLSIVIPYYNMGQHVEETIQSILGSSYTNKEIILVDDGSSEPLSLAKLDELEAKYDIKVFKKQNEGLSLARNYGSSKVKGEFVCFIDADDTVDADYFSKAIKVLKKYDNVHFVGCWVKYFEGSTGCWPAFNPEPPFLLVHNMVNSAPVYKTASFLKGGLNNPEMVYGMEDWDSTIGMVEKGLSGVVLPELLYNYRVRSNSMARNFTRVKKLYLHKLIAENHASLYRQYGVEVANILNSNGSGLNYDNPTFETSEGTSIYISSRFKEKLKEKVKRNKLTKSLALVAHRYLTK